MATVAKTNTGTWRVRYRDPSGRQREKTFPLRKAADSFANGVEADKVRGTYVDPNAGRITFREYAEQWRVAQTQHRPSSRAHVETMLRRHAYPTLGAKRIGSIRASDIRSWVSTLSQTLAPSTVKVAHGIVASVFLTAVDDRVIPGSPCQRRSRSGKGYLPETPHRQIEPLTTEAVHALTDATRPRYRTLIVLAAGTGLRQGECLGLTVDRIDFLRRTVTVNRQLVHTAGQGPAFGPPKTKASYRTVPLPQVVVDALAAHLAEFPANDMGLVFSTQAGRPIRRSMLAETIWAPAAKAAGLPDGATFHDLRHYYASLLIRHGESVKVVQARLGHATAAETLDTYSHLWPDSDDRTREAVDEVLGAQRSPAATEAQ